MIAGFKREHVSVEKTGSSCTIPNDNYIRLCYYLNCVAGTDCPEQIPQSVKNWQSMKAGQGRSINEVRTVLELCTRYAPPKMRQLGFFLMVPKSVSLNSSNEFYKMTLHSNNIGVLAGTEAAIVLQNKSSKSVTIMFYKEAWEDDNFYNPFKALTVSFLQAQLGLKR
jgi:hypothetical protein